MSQLTVKVFETEFIERGIDGFLDARVPGAPKLAGDKDLVAGNARATDALAD